MQRKHAIPVVHTQTFRSRKNVHIYFPEELIIVYNEQLKSVMSTG